MYIYVYIYVYICVYKNIYLCIYIYSMCIHIDVRTVESMVRNQKFCQLPLIPWRLDGTKWNWGPRPAEIRSESTFESSNHIELILELNRIDHASNGQYIYIYVCVIYIYICSMILILIIIDIIITINYFYYIYIYIIYSFIFEGLEPLRNWAISIRRKSPESAPLLKAATSYRPGGSKLPIKLHFLVWINFWQLSLIKILV